MNINHCHIYYIPNEKIYEILHFHCNHQANKFSFVKLSPERSINSISPCLQHYTENLCYTTRKKFAKSNFAVFNTLRQGRDSTPE